MPNAKKENVKNGAKTDRKEAKEQPLLEEAIAAKKQPMIKKPHPQTNKPSHPMPMPITIASSARILSIIS